MDEKTIPMNGKDPAVLRAEMAITRAEMDEMRVKYTQELLEAAKRVREEPQPSGDSIWDWVFATKNHVAGES